MIPVRDYMKTRVSNGMKERVLPAAISVFFGFLAAGLFYTQVLRYSYYSELSKNNSIRIIPIEAPRGSIFDRSGALLVSSRLSFDVALVYQELRDRRKVARLLKDELGMSGSRIASSFDKAAAKPYAPVTVAEDVDKEKAIAIEEAGIDAGGIVVETRSKRNYITASAGSHVFGYLGEVAEDELELLKCYGYRMKDLVGRDGLEKYYDTYLKGIDGGTQVEVDNRGRHMRILGLKEPSPGNDLYLAIDLSLQLACDRLLGGHKGAIIVMDPRTGEVLALASHPAFDPNLFVRPDTAGERLRLLKDRSGRPMSNKAISGLYPPGSVFKVVTASAALETKRVGANTRFFCGGSYRLGTASFACWKEGGHGSQNIREGLMNSCNVLFYQVGRLVGADQLEAFAKIFGFGKPSGIDLPDEVKGVVPGRAWKRLYRSDNWYEGETLNYAIGQGYLLVTPIQILDMMAVIANRGMLGRPYVVKKIGNNPVSIQKARHAGIRPETIEKVRQGLLDVVNGEHGTGKRARIEGVLVAGKTGTAENPQGPTHAWFAGFAPFDDPKICLVVFLEHGGKGGLEPADIARGIFEEARKRGYL